jgi:hypothetical protein
MFAWLPPSSSDLAERKNVFRHHLLQIGGANIANPPTSSSLAEETTPPLAPPQHGGARFSDARSCLALLAHRALFDCSLHGGWRSLAAQYS